MSNEENEALRARAERVIELEEEVEAGGVAGIDAASVEQARAALHKWVDEMTGVVVSPGLGRVTVLHGGGKQSSIGSSELAYRLSAPVKHDRER